MNRTALRGILAEEGLLKKPRIASYAIRMSRGYLKFIEVTHGALQTSHKSRAKKFRTREEAQAFLDKMFIYGLWDAVVEELDSE